MRGNVEHAIEPLLSELKTLEKGILLYDAYLKETVTVYAKLLFASGDYPALCKMTKQRQQPAPRGACNQCEQVRSYPNHHRKPMA